MIRRAVQGALLRGINDPRVRGLVSVTRVSVDSDLSEAMVHVSVLPEERAELTLAGLRSAAPHLGRSIRSELRARRMPLLRFVLDDSLKKAAAIELRLRRPEEEPDPGSEAPGESAEVGGAGEGAPDLGARAPEGTPANLENRRPSQPQVANDRTTRPTPP